MDASRKESVNANSSGETNAQVKEKSAEKEDESRKASAEDFVVKDYNTTPKPVVKGRPDHCLI